MTTTQMLGMAVTYGTLAGMVWYLGWVYMKLVGAQTTAAEAKAQYEKKETLPPVVMAWVPFWIVATIGFVKLVA